MNIVELIQQETATLTDRTAIVEGDRTITYGQLLSRVDRLRDALKQRGVGPGQRIAFRCADGIDYVIGALALLACDAAVVPVPDTNSVDEVLDTIDRIDVQAIVTHFDMPAIALPLPSGERAGVRGETPDPSTRHSPTDSPSLAPHPTSPLRGEEQEFTFQPRPAGSDYDARCRDLHAAFIRFSSGTTGESKGVVLSHQSIRDRTDAANAGLGVTNADVILWVLGMSHHFVVSILLFLRRGATIIVANKGFPFSVLEAAQKFPITLIYGSPVHYYLLGVSNLITPTALSNVRLAISTSMKMPPDVSTAFAEKFGFAPAEAYGIIEIGLPFINTEPQQARNTVGRALPAYELRIANPDEHGVGEVLVRGKGMFDAYFSPWRTRAECTDDGYFHTGDLGKLDDAGRLMLLGRSKTVIVCAGMKVFPEEVEQVINAIPGVRESLIFGKPHAQFGQVPVAHVVLADPSSDVIDSIRGLCIEHLSSYKVPVEYVAVESLPKTASGKLVRVRQSAE